MAAVLALIAAALFALAAALQQRGQFALARKGDAIEGVGGLLRLLAIPAWLLGTGALLCGYAVQGAALDRGKLVVVQPLLVTTIVWALPLGRWLTAQNIVPRQVLGAGVVVVGLALFVLVGDPDTGVESASTQSLVLAIAAVSAVVVALLVWLRSKRARRCALPCSGCARACSSACRRSSPSRCSTTCTSASASRSAIGGRGPCSASASSPS
jgi:drug/metabolite transporter (DMT)-like permease